jgi:hypothetical protein
VVHRFHIQGAPKVTHFIAAERGQAGDEAQP